MRITKNNLPNLLAKMSIHIFNLKVAGSNVVINLRTEELEHSAFLTPYITERGDVHSQVTMTKVKIKSLINSILG